IFGKKKIYAFDDNMKLNLEEIKAFVDQYQNETIFLFGFTYIIWEYFYKKLRDRQIKLPIKQGLLIHGGGWKKLSREAVSKDDFKHSIREVCGISRVYDYYGMAEQTGCICVECEEGHLHTSIFSDILMRRMKDFSLCQVGEPGVIQVFSTIPESYPGHALLTEDRGIILGEDDCPCGRKGKYFEVLGRIKNAEIRGCSDTFER
ncbi:MAG: acyl-protein synthetase, partial [Lachnoclostridium sp.]|nr:acyl-protein synthetase [Lachnoclostridium sp.]